jgi:hypothetical protein
MSLASAKAIEQGNFLAVAMLQKISETAKGVGLL